MRIQFIDSVAGARFAYRCGEKAELADDIARGFIKQGVAKRIDEEAAVEAAVVAAPENTARRTGRARRTLRTLGGLLPG